MIAFEATATSIGPDSKGQLKTAKLKLKEYPLDLCRTLAEIMVELQRSQGRELELPEHILKKVNELLAPAKDRM